MNVTLPEETLRKYKTGIATGGKTELMTLFAERFDLSDDVFRKYVAPSQTHFPTPERAKWIIRKIDEYYAYYQGNAVSSPEQSAQFNS